MRILMVNKFLYPNGGSETYCFKLGEYLVSIGHEVQYFGMEHEGMCVWNSVDAYTSNLDFHGASMLAKLSYPFKVIYSVEARNKIRIVLDDFHPDIVHLNNINFQLTPSIIYEIKKSRIPIVQTVHDCQIACPNHRMYIEHLGVVCDKCIKHGNYIECVRNRCLHASRGRSLVAALESYYYHIRDTYNLVDVFISPSRYMASVMECGGVERKRINILYNPTDFKFTTHTKINDTDRYILYFGRLSKEKGIETLLEVANRTPNISYIFAGNGPLEATLANRSNVKYVGFQSGNALKNLITNAVCTVYPSEWYENCPLSIIESQALGTPVIASDLGGTPELIDVGKTGQVFEAGNDKELSRYINELWGNKKLRNNMHYACLNKKQITMSQYTEDLMNIYELARQRQENKP